MSRTKRNQATMAASRAWQRARQTAEQAKPAAAQVKPLADSTRAATSRGLRRARTWAAPQVERTGHALEDTVAPKISALLSKAARRMEPAKPRRRRWRALAGISVLIGAIGAAAAALRSRMSGTSSAGDKPSDAAGPETTSADTDSKKPARTS